MARTAIFLTTIVATLIGPHLCCCAAAQLFAFEPACSIPVNTPKAVPVARPVCPHCAADAEPAVPDRPAPPDPGRPCPCCDDPYPVVQVPPSPPVAIAVDLPLVALLPVALDPRLIVWTTDSRVEHPPGQDARTFLIDFCHHLRC